jgi:hypothetical protein
MRTLKILVLFSLLFLCSCQHKNNDEFNTTPEYVLIDKETILI